MQLDKNLRAGSILAATALLGSFIYAFLLPVYTDEIVWRFQSRAALDRGFDMFVAAACGPSTIVKAPWFMMPARWFSTVVNQALPAPVFIKIEGQLCAILWLVLNRRLIGTIEPRSSRAALSRMLMFGLLNLGLLPFLMVLSRPEQPIILALGSMILVTLAPMAGDNRATAATACALKCAAILVLGALVLSYHPKGVLYSVVAAACLLTCGRGTGTVAPRLLAAAALTALTIVAARYWSLRFSCPGDPKVAMLLADQSVPSLLAVGGHLSSVWSRIALGALPQGYVAVTLPQPYILSNWIPYGVFPAISRIAFAIPLMIIWTGAFLLAALMLARRIWTKPTALAEPRVLIACAIFACSIVWGASLLLKNAYDASNSLPMLALMVVLTLSLDESDTGWMTWIVPKFAWAAFSMALLSQLVIGAYTILPLLHHARMSGYPIDQPYSVSIFGYRTVLADIRRARLGAGIPEHTRLRRLLLDDVTYLAFQDSYLPLHRLGVLSIFNGSINDPLAYLRRQHSEGVIMTCKFMTPAMRRIAVQSGEICAISGGKIASASKAVR